MERMVDKAAANKQFVLGLLKAFVDSDYRTIEKGLDQNFRNWRCSKGEVCRFDYLGSQEILFASWEFCSIDPTHIVADEHSVAVELRMTIKMDGETLGFLQHNLFVVEDCRLVSLRQYGDAPIS